MKKLFFIFTVIFYSPCSSAQTKFSAEVKRYIDYDTPMIVFRHSMLIDGTGKPAKANQTVIIKNGFIDWVGEDDKASFPKGSLVINAQGKTIIPGLVMLHEHMYSIISSEEPFYLHLKQLPVTFPRLYLAAGITAARTCGSVEPYADVRLKKDIDLGLTTGPALDLTAPYLEGENARFPQMNELKTEQAAAAFVNYWADQGFTSFKAYIGITRNVLKAAIDAAHKRNLKVTGHLCSITYKEAAELGIDHIEHGFFRSTDFVVGKLQDSCPRNIAVGSLASLNIESDSVINLIDFLVKKKIGITSTLGAYEGGTSTQPVPSKELLAMLAPDSKDYFLKRLASVKSGTIPTAFDKAFPVAGKLEKKFYDAGGLLTVGTDPTNNGGIIPPFSSWRAIELLVELDGFTTIQAIKIATLNGAIALGMDKKVGTIEKGKKADLVIIDGDLSVTISNIRKVVYVFKDGIGFNSKRMIESLEEKVGLY